MPMARPPAAICLPEASAMPCPMSRAGHCRQYAEGPSAGGPQRLHPMGLAILQGGRRLDSDTVYHIFFRASTAAEDFLSPRALRPPAPAGVRAVWPGHYTHCNGRNNSAEEMHTVGECPGGEGRSSPDRCDHPSPVPTQIRGLLGGFPDGGSGPQRCF